MRLCVRVRAGPCRIALACARVRWADCAVLGAPYLGDVMPWRVLQQNLRSREGVSYLRKSCGTTRCPRSRPEPARGRCPAHERIIPPAFSFSLLFLQPKREGKRKENGVHYLYIENQMNLCLLVSVWVTKMLRWLAFEMTNIKCILVILIIFIFW